MQQATISHYTGVLMSIALGLLLCSSQLEAQSISSARINEVMIHNVDNYMDSYGKRSPWIEIYNSSAGTINLAGCYLTNDPKNLKKYMIPKGDVLTMIKPRQSVVFFADDLPLRGTFHLNFTLSPEEAHYLALVSNDGVTIIDEVDIPASLPANHTYARIADGVRTKLATEGWQITEHTTPQSNNVVQDKNEKIDRLTQADPNGIVMTVTAMLVVFSGLLLLFLSYKLIGTITTGLERRKSTLYRTSVTKQVATTPTSRSSDPHIPIVIALALSTELEQSGGEAPGRLTLRQHSQAYSSWCDKSHLMRPTVDRKKHRI